MKIKTRPASVTEALSRERPKHKDPRRPLFLIRIALLIASAFDLLATRFRVRREGMDKIGKGPRLILMNHSSFIDLKIAYSIFFPRPVCTVCTSDGFVGKAWLMRLAGCIPTQKFVSDITLIRDISFALHKRRADVLMFPEASYSFDGTATPLPRKMGILLKKLAVPVVMVRTEGAFLRDPLYNGLRKRRTRVSARVYPLFTREELSSLSLEEIDGRLDSAFTYDHFATQKEKAVCIDEPFRATGLERILYRCPACRTEGAMRGEGKFLYCDACGKTWYMNEDGHLDAGGAKSYFSHIPDWYRYERDCVREEILAGTYCLSTPVKIGMMTDYRAIYTVGEGHLTHDGSGFTLRGPDGEVLYTQSPLAAYGLYADYFWYEIGDVICIGNRKALYYCFPPAGVPVARARLAAEELYKIKKEKSDT